MEGEEGPVAEMEALVRRLRLHHPAPSPVRALRGGDPRSRRRRRRAVPATEGRRAGLPLPGRRRRAPRHTHQALLLPLDGSRWKLRSRGTRWRRRGTSVPPGERCGGGGPRGGAGELHPQGERHGDSTGELQPQGERCGGGAGELRPQGDRRSGPATAVAARSGGGAASRWWGGGAAARRRLFFSLFFII